jgi:hypothetical protein
MMGTLSPGASGQNLCERKPNFPRVLFVPGTSLSSPSPLHLFVPMLFFLTVFYPAPSIPGLSISSSPVEIDTGGLEEIG